MGLGAEFDKTTAKTPSRDRFIMDTALVHIHNGPIGYFVEGVNLLTLLSEVHKKKLKTNFAKQKKSINYKNLFLSANIPDVNRSIIVISGRKEVATNVMAFVRVLMFPLCCLLKRKLVK